MHSTASMFSTGELQIGVGLPRSALMVGLRMTMYHAKPYVELQIIVPAIVQPSDSLTSAVDAVTQKPTNVNPASTSIIGMRPSGMSARLMIRVKPARTRVIHDARYMPTVAMSFAVAY